MIKVKEGKVRLKGSITELDAEFTALVRSMVETYTDIGLPKETAIQRVKKLCDLAFLTEEELKEEVKKAIKKMLGKEEDNADE